jgi:hypothetical protein
LFKWTWIPTSQSYAMDKTSQEYKRYRAEISRKHRANHPEKVKARVAGQVLGKQPCQYKVDGDQCGKMPTEAHHPDYKKPWTVQWYCKTHHELVDTALGQHEEDM